VCACVCVCVCTYNVSSCGKHLHPVENLSSLSLPQLLLKCRPYIGHIVECIMLVRHSSLAPLPFSLVCWLKEYVCHMPLATHTLCSDLVAASASVGQLLIRCYHNVPSPTSPLHPHTHTRTHILKASCTLNLHTCEAAA